MSATMQKLRATGRTTRMLAHAEQLARAGRAVYVVADTDRDCKRLQTQWLREGRPADLGVKFETPGTLGNLDWEAMKLRNAHPNCVVLVDHWAIESRFARMLEMLHAYDPSTEDSQ